MFTDSHGTELSRQTVETADKVVDKQMRIVQEIASLLGETAAVVGYLCIRLLKYVAEKGRFGAFAYYCWAVGVLTLVLQAVK